MTTVSTVRAGPSGVGESQSQTSTAPGVRVIVCSSCRLKDDPPDAPRAGTGLAAATRAAAQDTGIATSAIACFGNCSRGLTAAIVTPDAWTYVFGDLGPDSAQDLIAGALLMADAPDGLMPWRPRPQSLKRGMIARIPPPNLLPGLETLPPAPLPDEPARAPVKDEA